MKRFVILLLATFQAMADVSWNAVTVNTSPVTKATVTNALGYEPAQTTGGVFTGQIVATSYAQLPIYTNYSGLLFASVASDAMNTYSIGSHVTNWPGALSWNCSADTTNGPILVTGSCGLPALKFCGTNYLVGTAPLALNTNCTIFMALECDSGLNTGDKALFGGAYRINWSSDTVAMAGFLGRAPIPVANPGRYVGFLQFKYGDSTWNDHLNGGLNGSVITSSSSTTTLGWAYNGQVALGSLITTLGGSGNFVGTVYEFAAYTNSLTADASQTIIRYLMNKYQVASPSVYFADGDQEFIGGAMNVHEKNWSPVFHQLDNVFAPHVGGIMASTVRDLGDIQASATNTISGLLANNYFQCRLDHLYLLMYGVTYLQTGSGATLFGITSNCMAAARSIGYVVPAMTLLPIGGTNDSERLVYNNLVRQHWPSCSSALVDFMVLPFTTPTDYTNGTYYIQDNAAGWVPSTTMSGMCSELLMRTVRKLCSTNLVVK